MNTRDVVIKRHNKKLSMKSDEEVVRDWWEQCHLTDDAELLTGSKGEDVWCSLNIEEKILPKSVILNIGVGRGYCTRGLAQKQAIVHALDISEAALNKVKDIVARTWKPEQLDDLPSDTFDLAISHLVAQHMSNPDLRHQIKAVVRSLKPHGVFALQFAFSADKEYVHDEQSGVIKKTGKCFQEEFVVRWGGICRTLIEMQKMVKEVGGNIIWIKKTGSFPTCNSGWYGIHIVKDTEANLQHYLVAERKRTLAESFNQEGERLVEIGKAADAFEAFSKALELDPTYADAWYNIGSFYNKQGEKSMAVESFRKALSFEPYHRKTIIALAEFLQKEESELDNVIDLCTSYLNAKPNDKRIRRLLDAAQSEKKRLIENLQCSPEEMQRRKELADVMIEAGEALLENEKDISGAKEAFCKALEIFPSSASAQNNFGIAYWQEGKFNDALQHFKKAVELEPANTLFETNYREALAYVSNAQIDRHEGSDPN